MKPAQIIQEEKKKFECIIADAATKFAEETGGAIKNIDIQFINTTHFEDSYTRTTIGKINVTYLL